MAQATRCPHCQTAFKVVRDQLLLREGWVRCGHCGEAFNALDHLIDLAPPAQPQPRSEPTSVPDTEVVSPPAAPQTEAPEPPTSSGTVPQAAGMRWSSMTLESPAYPELMPLTTQPYDIAPISHKGPFDEAVDQAETTEASAFVGPTAETEPSFDETIETNQAKPSADPDEAESEPLSAFSLNDALNYRFDNEEEREPAPITEPETEAQAPEPEFLRSARRQAFWNSTPARVSLSVFSVVLLGLLAVQAALHWRDTLAQQWPGSRPWLQQLCAMTTGCELAAPRDLDALVIDNSSLSPAAQGLELTVLLRNRIDRAVAWPALELTLNDAQGGIEQRKVVQPAQYLAATQATDQTLRAGLAPGQQVRLSLHLTVSGTLPSGYKLLLFYP